MRAKIFFGASLLYILIIWLLVHSFFNQMHEISVFGFKANLNIASWVIVPLGLYFLFTMLHFAFCEWRIFRSARALKSDIHGFEEVAKAALIGQNCPREFKTRVFETPVALASALTPWRECGEVRFSSERLNETYALVREVKAGRAVNLKPLKLDFTSEMFVQNELNRVRSDYAYALGLLSSGRELNARLRAAALAEVAARGSFDEVVRFEFEPRVVMVILVRLARAGGLNLEQVRRFMRGECCGGGAANFAGAAGAGAGASFGTGANGATSSATSLVNSNLDESGAGFGGGFGANSSVANANFGTGGAGFGGVVGTAGGFGGANFGGSGGFTANDFITAAIISRNLAVPEEVIALFDELKNANAEAAEAYAYLLYDFGRIDLLREFLASTEAGFVRIKTLLFLKENNKFCSTDLFYKVAI